MKTATAKSKAQISADRGRVQKKFEKKSLTEQSHAPFADIRRILDRYNKTGTVDHFNKNPIQYGSDIGRPEFHEAMNIITSAKSHFSELPAKQRLAFHNDPAEFVEFCSNADNIDAMKELGIDTSHFPEKPSDTVSAKEADKLPVASSKPGSDSDKDDKSTSKSNPN